MFASTILTEFLTGIAGGWKAAAQNWLVEKADAMRPE